jgi:protein translocase SecG subunit
MTILLAIHALVSILLCLSILIQHRASGLSATFGGSGAVVVQRRGAERVVYRASIWLSVAFFVLAVVELYVAA